jgi:sensor c-di-GMP phosphodiesterase-like protein
MNTESLQKIRAIRRRHQERMILKRKSRVDMGRWHVKSLGYLAKNNTVCSCWMCGNPRKYFGEVTVQERKFKQAYQRGEPCSNRAVSL